MSSPSLNPGERFTASDMNARLIPGVEPLWAGKGPPKREVAPPELPAWRKALDRAHGVTTGHLTVPAWERIRLGMRFRSGARNVLIIGAGGLGRQIARHLESHPELGRAFCG